MAFTDVTVTGTYRTAAGAAAVGAVTFTPVTEMRNGDIRISAPVSAQLVAGAFTVTLAATTDPDTVPAGVTYRVETHIVGDHLRNVRYLEIPHDGGTIDLADASFAETVPATQVTYLTQAAGDARYLQIDADTAVATTVGPAPSGDETGTDDTAAIQAILDDDAVVAVDLPAGAYFTTGLVVPPGKTLRGTFGRTYSGTFAAGTGTVINAVGTIVAVEMQGDAVLDSVAVNGPAGATGSGIKFTGRTNAVRDCAVRNFAINIDGNYQQVNLIQGCDIFEGGVGIKDVIDSVVISCWISGHSSHGVTLGGGANDNSITACKVEWNGGRGIDLFQSNHNTISNNVFDRNSESGLRITQANHCTATANVLRRNGAGQSGNAGGGEDVHIHLETVTGCVVMGNVTNAGDNDGGGGYASPTSSIYLLQCTDTQVIGNSWIGCTGELVSDDGGHTRLVRALNTSGTSTPELPTV